MQIYEGISDWAPVTYQLNIFSSEWVIEYFFRRIGLLTAPYIEGEKNLLSEGIDSL